ncbi:MAG: hypothetical protein ACTSWC_08105 [Promethearchaeota archaeon]
MFESEREESDAFFSYFSEKYGEEVGLMLSFYDDEEFEIDLIVGMDSETIYGLNVIQSLLAENIEEDREDNEDGDDDEDDEDEDEYVDELQYLFVKMDIPPSKLEGKPYFQIDLSENPGNESNLESEPSETQIASSSNNPDKSANPKNEVVSVIFYAKPLPSAENQELSDLPAHLVQLTGAIKFSGELSAPTNVTVYGIDPSLN